MDRVDLHAHDEDWRGCEAQAFEVLTLEVEGDGLAKIGDGFVEGRPLSDDGDFGAFGNEAAFIASSNDSMDGPLEFPHRSLLSVILPAPVPFVHCRQGAMWVAGARTRLLDDHRSGCGVLKVARSVLTSC